MIAWTHRSVLCRSFGYRPFLAESFTDPEAYEGTCYKPSNWESSRLQRRLQLDENEASVSQIAALVLRAIVDEL